MTKKEIAELKKRFTKDRASFQRICGCYVDAEKNKVYSFSQKFLTLPDEDLLKYLEIAKKTLSGKPENNLLDLSFPTAEEFDGGRQHMLMKLVSSKLEDESALGKIYDSIIENYATIDNYLILLFCDAYDVMSRGSDGMDNDSEDVYQYMICAVCPVTLAKASLAYTGDKIEAVKRDWLVGAPESAFLFPAFNDRCSDIHSALFYTKSTKAPHEEMMTEILGCSAVTTASAKQEIAYSIVGDFAMGESGDEEDQENAILAFNQGLQDCLEEHVYDGYEESSLKMDEAVITRAVEEIGIEEKEAEKIAEEIIESFDGNVPTVASMISSKLLKENADRVQILVMQEKIKDLLEENEQLKELLELERNAGKK